MRWTTLLFVAGAMLSVFTFSNAATKAEVQSLIDQAEVERQKASEVEYEWRYTAKYIEDAKKLLEENKLDEAMELAEQALFEGVTAQEQYKTSQQIWMFTVPR